MFSKESLCPRNKYVLFPHLLLSTEQIQESTQSQRFRRRHLFHLPFLHPHPPHHLRVLWSSHPHLCVQVVLPQEQNLLPSHGLPHIPGHALPHSVLHLSQLSVQTQ